MSEQAFDRHHFDYAPWEFAAQADPAARAEQLGAQDRLRAQRPGTSLGEDVYLSPLATIQTDTLAVGDRTTVAALAHLSGDVTLGADCSVNVSTVVRGTVAVGDGVRIGGQTSLLGFNHGTDPAAPIRTQPLTTRGITVGDDVWVGSHVVVLDGVTIGAGVVVGAGAVVTRDVPAGAIVGGNPARVIRWRTAPASPVAGLEERLGDLGARLPDDLVALLERCWDPERSLFRDVPGAEPTLRAQCDAVELAALAGLDAPPQWPREDLVGWLRARQDAATGLVAPLDRPGAELDLRDGEVSYHLLSVGYALDLLGSDLPHPVAPIATMAPGEVVALLDGLDWEHEAWGAGHLVDALGTGWRWNLAQGLPGAAGSLEALVGWLTTRQSPRLGVWGTEQPGVGLLQVVNGFYRASRGTYAQLGLPLPYPERTVDTVLRHAADLRYFVPERQNACNVLDVVHPLWLAGRQTAHRRDEVVALAERLCSDALGRYRGGFAFAAGTARRPDPDRAVALRGTEMWLAILWYLADLLDLTPALGYQPRGVHSPDPFAPGPSGLGGGR